MMFSSIPSHMGTTPLSSARGDALRKSALQLEASFLAVMLKMAGAERSPDAFGGGVGEEQFTSFLGQARAEEMVKMGGIGLAERICAQFKENLDGRG